MTPPVDPNEVLMTGENSFVRLSHDGGQTMTDRFSHWRVLWCPAGAGHALFAQTTAFDKQVRVYSDNVAVARWLQKTIETLLHPPFADPNLPVFAAEFARTGDPRSSAVESVVGDDDMIRLTWWDCIEPFVLNAPPGFNNPGARGAGRDQRRRGARQGVGGDARRPSVVERLPGVVRELGEAPQVGRRAS
jgi:hypothetical protein